jgi:hypothetical protein
VASIRARRNLSGLRFGAGCTRVQPAVEGTI